MRKDCRIWTCECSTSFEGRAKYFEHRKTCTIHQEWRKGCYKRSAETLKRKYENMTEEEKQAERKKRSEIQKKAVTKERREAQSKRTVFNNFWKYRAKNPIIYESKTAGKMKLDSNWELKVAKRLDDLNVEWFRPKYTLPYLDCDGVQHLYHPDFYVKTFNCFIEVKSEFVAKHQNSNNKCEYIKEHYPFVKWIETEEDCENFLLEDLKCDFMPEKDEEDISYWLKMEEQKKKEAEAKKQVKSERKVELEQKKKEAEAKKHEAELKLLQESGIDFSKFGWTTEAAILLNKHPNKVGNYIRKNFPELNVFTRKGDNSNSGKHWWTNGTEEISAVECPPGFHKGRANTKKFVNIK